MLEIKSWCQDIEQGAWDQAVNLANLPFAFKHIALMPDAHQGYGMPIGGVMATKGVVVPYAVGVDIGCGMCAVKVSNEVPDRETLKEIMGDIRKVIPVGKNRHQDMQDNGLMPVSTLVSDHSIVVDRWKNSLHQLGTLGGGNHFIELQESETGEFWLMIHSGSRNVGKRVCDHYHEIAKKLCTDFYSDIPDQNLSFLPLDSADGRNYMDEMQWCVEYALANRRLMMARALGCISIHFPVCHGDMINIAHNYAAMEHHFGHNVLVHRKGATRARKNDVGIIPGSQGTASYIVIGKGNMFSFESCSHGAGRCMGRKAAQRSLNLAEEIEKMGDVIHGMRSEKDLDEASSAYKDIESVMEQQEDLVEIVHKLRPLAVIKG